MRRIVTAGVLAAAVLACGAGVDAQTAPQRTLEELKAEAQARADRNAYPLAGLKPDEVREALSRLHSLDRDEWAASWSVVGDRYMEKAKAEAGSARAQADADDRQAWLYYSFARWPVPNSPGKQRAYEKALEAYAAHGQLLDPPIQTVRVPFEGKEIVGYLQMPKGSQMPGGASAAPMVIAISGLDSRKEDMAERFQPMLAYGVGSLALDAPGAGQSPIKAAPGAERMLTQALEYVLARPDVDKSRVAVYGGSFGGLWATILAVTEKPRLRAVVAQSGPIHDAYSRPRTMALSSNREYLFDYVPAQLDVFEGATDLDKLADVRERISLKTRGFLDKPMAPMLVIGGVLDTQVPFADIELLLQSGDSPKDAWINPRGGHMGRDAKDWPDPVIFKKVTMPWLLRQLDIKAEVTQ
ncbi:MAG: alpha/beta hydrolase [Alphaproteobacteria bacterium]|nr:alpha/beta hydrolase [Alphaproteobacteria bacterium]